MACNAGTCELVEQPLPGDTPCDIDADCKVEGDCCSGCTPLHVDEALPECLKGCADPACTTSHGAPLVATCNAGTCEFAATTCAMASDCQVVNDCCLGCVAMPTDSPLPQCELQCVQDACSAEYGSDAEISASCEASECSLLVALP